MNLWKFGKFGIFGRKHQFFRQDSVRHIQTRLDLTYSDIIHAKITKNKKKFLPFFPFKQNLSVVKNPKNPFS